MRLAHSDPIIALSVTRRRLAEYAVPEAIDRNTAFPGTRVWLIEIERAKGDVPGGIAVWRSRGADGEWRTRCACVWTHGPIGAPSHPLVIGAQWHVHGEEAAAGACVIESSWEQATHAATDRSCDALLERRRNAIGPELMARIAIPAALAWLDAHNGVARAAGRFGVEERARARHRPPTVHPVRAPGRTPPAFWLAAAPERAAEALVLRTAGEGWRVGANCPVRQWRDGWAGYAELGAVAWHAVPDLNAPVDADRWLAMERALHEGSFTEQSAQETDRSARAAARGRSGSECRRRGGKQAVARGGRVTARRRLDEQGSAQRRRRPRSTRR